MSCAFQGQATATCCPQNTTLDANVFVDPVFLNISQYAIHTLDTALQSWQQVIETAKHSYNKMYTMWLNIQTSHTHIV